MKLAYLVNQYPMISLSFIRREIAAIEAMGLPIQRFAIRRWAGKVVDQLDLQEAEKTRYILDRGALPLLLAVVKAIATRPTRFWRALKLTLQIGKRSDRGLLVNVVYLAEACVLLQWLLADGIDHVHTHFGSNSAAVAMLCRELGGPSYSITIHGPEEFDKAPYLALGAKIERSAFVVGVSSFSLSQLFRWCNHTQWSKVHIVRCGIDDLFLTQPLTPIPTTPRFVCVGRLTEQKGHLLLLEAAGQLAAEGLQFKLALLGDGELRPEIEQLIQHHHLENHVELLGWATNVEVRKQILAAQAMVLPSFAEGLPVVFMEALALGRPVVSTYIAGIPELVKPNETGWLVPAGSVTALAEAMRSLIHTPPETLEAMGRKGAAIVAENHNIHLEAERLVNLIKEAIANNPTRLQ
jgi:colanic acid/amylovoran biosynthesis glycosyltransferase